MALWVGLGFPLSFRWIHPQIGFRELVGKDDVQSSPTSTTTEPERGHEWNHEGEKPTGHTETSGETELWTTSN